MKITEIVSRIPLRVLAIWILCGILLPMIVSHIVRQRLAKNQGVTLIVNGTPDYEESFLAALTHATENQNAPAQIHSYIWIQKHENYLLLLTGQRKCHLYINDNLVLDKIGKFRESTTIDLPPGFALLRLDIEKSPKKLSLSKDCCKLDFQWSRNFVNTEPIAPYQSFLKPISTAIMQLGNIARILDILARFNMILVFLWILIRIFNIPLIPKESSSILWILIPALILMLWLRFSGIGYLMQEGLHPDEKMYGSMTREIFSGNLAPDNFWYTTGFFYIASAAQKLSFWLAGDLVTRNMILRFLSAIFSWLSCILVFSIGRASMSKNAGILATLFFGFSFMPIELAHIGIVEPTMVFFFLLAFSALVNLKPESDIKEFAKAGLFAGVAISVKQTAAIIVVPFLITYVLLIQQKFRKKTQKFVCWTAAAAFGFFVLSPGTIFSFSDFYRYQTFQYHSLRGETHTRLFFLHKNLTFGMQALDSLQDSVGYPLLIAAGLGMIWVWKKYPRAGLLLTPVTVLYLIIAANTVVLPEHYVLLLCPFIALFAACAVTSIPVTKPSYKKYVIAGLSVLLLYPSAQKVMLLQEVIRDKDTRVLASEWCYKNLPPSARIDRELFGPQFLIPMFETNQIRLFTRPPWEQYLQKRKPQYFIEDGITWGRFLNFEKDFPVEVEWDRNLKTKARLIKEFRGRKFRLLNPDIRIYKIPAEAAPTPALSSDS